MIWDETAECAPRDELRGLQTARLREVIRRVSRTELYRQSETRSINPETVTLEHLPDLFFTRKDDLRVHYPFGLLTCDVGDLIEIHASSGTTGKPTVVGYTRGDIAIWRTAMARSLTAVGVTKTDVVQNAFGYGLFTGGLGFHYGCEEIEAAVIPIGGGRTELQLTLAEDLGSTILCCTPSFAAHLAAEAEQTGRSLEKTKLRIGIFGAEAWSEGMRSYIESKTGMVAFDMYGLSEIIGPGVAFECVERNGLHINEDLFYPEVVDRASGEAVAEGELGELVLTSLRREALPLIRYRTGDLVALAAGTCGCGRTLRRMSRVLGRADDMLIVSGVNFYPSQVESFVLGVPGTNGHYEIWLRTEAQRDIVDVRVEAEPDLFSDPDARDTLARHVAARLRDNIGLPMGVDVVEPGTLERPVGKAVRVFDKRGAK